MWNKLWAGSGRATPVPPHHSGGDEDNVLENGMQDRCSQEEPSSSSGQRTSFRLSCRQNPLSPATLGSRDGQGPSPSLASALFPSGTRFMHDFPARLATRNSVPDFETPLNIEAAQLSQQFHANARMRTSDLRAGSESMNRSSTSDVDVPLIVASGTALLGAFSRGVTPPIPEEPRTLDSSDEERDLRNIGVHCAENGPRTRKHKWLSLQTCKGLIRRIREFFVQTWGGSVYGMFTEDDVKAFEQSISGYPPFFLDSKMEAQFVRVLSRRVTWYYMVLTFFWATFLTITFGSFLANTKYIHLAWTLPYIIGIGTALLLSFAYLILAGAVKLRIRALVRDRQKMSSRPENVAEDDSSEEQKQDSLAATERQASFNRKVYHLRWMILRDIIIGVAIILNFASWAITYAAVGCFALVQGTFREESGTYHVSLYLREDIFTSFCFFVVFHLVCPIRVQTHLLVLVLALCFFWIDCIILCIAFREHAAILTETIMMTAVLLFACALRSTMERMHRFVFFLRQRAKGTDDTTNETLTGLQACSTTPVEELILLVNAAGLKLRTARKKLRYRRQGELVEAEGMLMRCLMILTARDDLFAFVLDNKEQSDLRNEVLTAFGANVAFRAVFKDTVKEPNLKTLGKKTSSFVAGTSNCMDSTCPNWELPAITSLFAASPLDLWHFADDGGRDAAVMEKDAKVLRKATGFPTGLMTLSKLSARISIQWDLSMLEVNNFCNNCCLFYVGHDMLFYKITGFSCPNQIVINFLWAVQLMYQPTLYHSHMHGAQVAHNVLWLARSLDLTCILSPSELVSLIVASLCHDVGHEGRNNAYYTATNHPLSIIYNDVAVLENFHACLTFKILQRAECDIFQELDPNVSQCRAIFSIAVNHSQTGVTTTWLNQPGEMHRMACRGHIIDLILATDMKLHFENISKFRLRRSSPDFDKTQGDDLWQTLRMCMKGGDISHALLPWEDHLAWSYRAISEFYLQGDEDLAAGRDVTPMFDRAKHAELPKGQAGFIRFVVLPLYEELDAVCPSNVIEADCLARAEENLRNWHAAEEDQQGFQAVDHKQQETLRMQLALLATQKAINKRLSYKLKGRVQIVPPERSNSGADGSGGSPTQTPANGTCKSAGRECEQRGSFVETIREPLSKRSSPVRPEVRVRAPGPPPSASSKASAPSRSKQKVREDLPVQESRILGADEDGGQFQAKADVSSCAMRISHGTMESKVNE